MEYSKLRKIGAKKYSKIAEDLHGGVFSCIKDAFLSGSDSLTISADDQEANEFLRQALSRLGYHVALISNKEGKYRRNDLFGRRLSNNRHILIMEIRPRLKGKKLKAFNNLTKKENRVLVIGDLHEPFCLDGYLEFCLESYQKYNCNKVIFIGDIIDNHYSSYHETDADGMGGGQELDLAIDKISEWYKIFHTADIIIGNHDRMIMRKAQTSQVPKKWIKSYSDVLGVPQWDFKDRVIIDGVQYVHGEGGTARAKCRADMMSTVQGHLHTQAYCDWYVGQNFRIFGMQTGCGIDHDSYAMAYAKRGKKPAIGCGVIIGGHTAINLLMDL